MKRKYEKCECPEANSMCCGGFGPAVFLVKRGGKKLKLCTRCDFSSDKRIKLLITGKEPARDLIKFDALGALCLTFALKDAREKALKKVA